MPDGTALVVEAVFALFHAHGPVGTNPETAEPGFVAVDRKRLERVEMEGQVGSYRRSDFGCPAWPASIANPSQ